MSKNSKMKILTNGILNENPVLRLVLGTCPTLAVTTMAANGIGMGLAATFVLICANVVISALRNIIPGQVRIPCYITVIAGFVTLVQMLVKAFVPSLDSALGVFLPLIVVNCIILGRAEMFASKNGIFDSALDGLGMGLGFLVALILIATLREVLGNGSFAGITIPFLANFKIPVLTQAPGGFLVYGIVIAIMNKLTEKKGGVKKKSFSCEGCPSSGRCGKSSCSENTEKEVNGNV